MEAAKLTSKHIWQKALDTLRGTRRQTLIISAAGLVLPQLLVDLWFDVRGARAAEALKELFSAHANAQVAFWDLVTPAIAFAGPFFAASILVLLIDLAAYFALVQIAIQHMRDGTQLGAAQAFKLGLSAAMRRLPGLFVVALMLAFFGQLFVAPALVAAVLSLMVPVITEAEQKGVLVATRDAVTVRYGRHNPFGVWAVAFNLLSIGASFYFALMLVALAVEQLLALDDNLPILHRFWSAHWSDLPFGPIYSFVSLSEPILLMAVVAALPAVTAALYFTVAAPRELARV